MKVFLDVGAHMGQTLAAAKRWSFDRIVCFEPAGLHQKGLRKMADARTTIEPVGLWDKTAEAPLYDVGSQGASIWERPGRPTHYEVCRFVRASDWFREHLQDGDQVWMKLNSEGAELDVIVDLLDSGEFDRISYLLVMWDARKIPAIAGRVAAVRERLAALYSAPRVICNLDIPSADTHTGRVDNWLAQTDIARLP